MSANSRGPGFPGGLEAQVPSHRQEAARHRWNPSVPERGAAPTVSRGHSTGLPLANPRGQSMKHKHGSGSSERP